MKKFEELSGEEIDKLTACGLLWELYPDAKPPFNQDAVFKAVDESNVRFNSYTATERKEFRKLGKSKRSYDYDWYPKIEKDYSDPYKQPLYFIEYTTNDGSTWRYKICKRCYIIPEDKFNLATENSGDDAWLLLGVEGHSFTLHEGVVNVNENMVDMETQEFLEFLVDALNEKVENANIKKIADNWNHASTKSNEPYYECRKCNRRLEELRHLGKAKFCGDFWKCTECDNDITKDLKSWLAEVKNTDIY